MFHTKEGKPKSNKWIYDVLGGVYMYFGLEFFGLTFILLDFTSAIHGNSVFYYYGYIGVALSFFYFKFINPIIFGSFKKNFLSNC